MKRARRNGGRIVRHGSRGGASFCWPGPLGCWLVTLFVGLMVGAQGCANNRLPAFQRGTSCSAERVQQYAAAHNMTYEQALGELRKQDDKLWQEEEARQAKEQRKEPLAPSTDTPPTMRTASPDGASATGSLRRYDY